MNKKQFLVICLLLAAVLVMLFYVAHQNNQLIRNINNIGNYLSEKVDVLTGKVNEMRA